MKKKLLLIVFISLSINCYSQEKDAETKRKEAEANVKEAEYLEKTAQLNLDAERIKKKSEENKKEAESLANERLLKTEENKTAEEKEKLKTEIAKYKTERAKFEVEKAKYKTNLVNNVDTLNPNESKKYFARVITTNFSVPLARFNFTKTIPEDISKPEVKSKKGEITLFTSIGAGISYNYGVYRATTNGNSEIVNEEFTNIIGAQIGFLFSAGTGEDTKNVFAPVLNIVLLDFQVGLGYELGNVNINQKRTFVTLSYAIPLYKLTKTGFYILKKRPALPIETNDFIKV
ncbi:hypothetical protein FNW52_12650 [Flavobacterium sp. ZT3R18]|uniref:hypothetical protein n=1 Tax=Flavobacterium sp. ZT3R18 TaxID=2594429 RepID=UPI001179F80E|nr:hypothetical protein [Flavobacterium sp. ZT3R18]TRX34984.1 hypothetical protein FNW52_12650 [Flavobacterium sp. ZT3R18]